MSIFELAADDFERFEDFSEKAIYKKRDGSESEIKITCFQRGATLEKGSPFGSQGKNNVGLVWLLKSQVPNPQPGESLLIAGVIWRLARMEISDPHRSVVEVTSGGSVSA